MQQSQPFLSNIAMRQCHRTTFRTCSPLILLYLVLFLRFIFRPRQFRILKLAFAIRILFICIFYGSILIWVYTHIWLCIHIWLCTIDLSSDIENNPEPRPSSSQNFSICHWNLNSITAHSYVKMSLLNLIQFVCQKHTSTQVFLYMMSIWKYRVMNQCDQTTHRNIKGVVYVSISEIPFHRKY